MRRELPVALRIDDRRLELVVTVPSGAVLWTSAAAGDVVVAEHLSLSGVPLALIPDEGRIKVGVFHDRRPAGTVWQLGALLERRVGETEDNPLGPRTLQPTQPPPLGVSADSLPATSLAHHAEIVATQIAAASRVLRAPATSARPPTWLADSIDPLTAALLAGGSTGEADVGDETCLHAAARVGNVGAIKTLVFLGADPNVLGGAPLWRTPCTPLHVALHSGNRDATAAMLSAPGLDPNARDGLGRAPLHCVTTSRSGAPLVGLLLRAPLVDPNVLDRSGKAPLHYCAAAGSAPTLRLLLGAPGIAPNVRDADGCSPLHVAVSSYSVDSVRVLVADPRVEVNARDDLGNTPLHALWTLQRGAIPASAEAYLFGCLEQLLACPRTDPNARNNAGDAPLHVFARLHGGLAGELVAQGGRQLDVNVRDAAGRTPLHIAVEYSSASCVAELCRVPGIDASARDADGRTPLAIARRTAAGPRRREVLAILEKAAAGWRCGALCRPGSGAGVGHGGGSERRRCAVQ